MRKLSLWSAALALAGVSAVATAALPEAQPFEQCNDVPGRSLDGHTAPAAKSLEAFGADMARLHAELTRDAAPMAKRSPLSVTLSMQERFAIGEIADCADCAPVEAAERRKLVGVAKPIGFEVDLSRAYAKKAVAGVRLADDGGFAWTQSVQSKGAMALRIGFEGLNLPIGAELYVYNRAGEAHGPYTGRGMSDSGRLVSHSVTGDTAMVQLRMYGEPSASDLAQLKFRIAHVGHIGPGFELARRLNASMQGEKAFCDYNASCVINGECASGWSHLSDVRSAIAHMLFKSGRYYYICSGGLLNNSRNDNTPLFLTANHCLNREREADTLEAYFDFRASSCGSEGWCDYSYTQLRSAFPNTLGAAMLASGSNGDFSLMQLDQNPAGTRHYMGWSTTAVANSNGTDLFRISHPGGAPQAWSTHDVNADGFSCGTLPRGPYIYSNDSAGATEGGSSGSPVLNSAGQVVGQLYGACGSNLNDNCDSVNNLTVDGALAAYFPNVESFLDPTGGGDPGDPGDVTASVQSVTVSTSTKGPWTHYTATVVVVDGSGNPVANATVSGNWSGAVSGSGSGTTDGSGTATVGGAKTRGGGSAQFCVTGVAGSGITFDGTTACGSGG